MRGLWLWTVTLFSFALFLRGEEPLCLKLRHLNCLQTIQVCPVLQIYITYKIVRSMKMSTMPEPDT